MARTDLTVRWAFTDALADTPSDAADAVLLTLALSDLSPEVRGKAALLLPDAVSSQWAAMWYEDAQSVGASGNLLLLAAARAGEEAALHDLQSRLSAGDYWFGRYFLEQCSLLQELPIGSSLILGARRAEPGQDVLMAGAAWSHGEKDAALEILYAKSDKLESGLRTYITAREGDTRRR